MLKIDPALMMPLLTPERQEMFGYYKLVFDEDGTPMKRVGDSRVFHPLLAAYLIVSFEYRARALECADCLAFARQIAARALALGERRGGALIFPYDPDAGLSSMGSRFYSALTQAWYIKACAILDRHDPGSFRAPLLELIASLMIPVDQGGVLIRRGSKIVVEEYPNDPPLYTLNGWLSVLRWLLEVRDVLERYWPEITPFLNSNLDALEEMLPLFDVPELCNSRYQLTGPVRIKIAAGVPMTFSKGVILAPGGRSATIEPESGRHGRMANYVERRERQFCILNGIISLAEPDLFRLQARVEVSASTRIQVQMGEGAYRPNASAMPTTTWRPLWSATIPAGIVDISCDLAGGPLNLYAYPTNFKKMLRGRAHNVYHFIHVMGLADLFASTRRPPLRTFAQRWLDYIDQWPMMEALSGCALESPAHGKDFRRRVMALLD